VSFHYLATVYSKHPDGIEEAYRMACRETAVLIQDGVRAYSPIAHTHGVAIHGGIDPYDHGIWLHADAPFMAAAEALIVLTSEGWREAYGIGKEIEAFRAAGKPVRFMSPGSAELRDEP
jgi:hypothetical protein